MWGWVLRAAVALGLDKWARRKAGELIVKIRDKAKAKIEHMESIQTAIEAPAAGETAVFRGIDGRDYVVAVVRRVV